jgi:hypothetical protein
VSEDDVRHLITDNIHRLRATRARRAAAAVIATFALGSAVLLAGVAQASATVLEPLSIEQMSARSARAVVGIVTAVREDAGTSATGPRTAVDIAVSDTLKGSASGALTVYVPGGTAPGGYRMVVDGMPSFTVGESCAVFADGSGWVMGGYQGKVLVRGASVPGEGESVAAFSARVRAAKGGAVGLPVAPQVSGPSAPALSPSGVPVVTSAAGPVITSVSPSTASAGTGQSITISGSGFGSSGGSVSFFYQSGQARIPATSISLWSNSTIVCQVPVATVSGYAASAGSGDVLVTTSGGLTSTAATSGSANLSIGFGYGGYRWATTSSAVPHTRVTFRVNPGGVANGQAMVQAAAATWDNAGADFAYVDGGLASTTQFENAPDYHNDLMWASGVPSGIIAQAETWTDNAGHIIDCDVRFSTVYAWGNGTGGTMDVQSIALHEIGHWLFLRDLYGPADSSKVMYGFGNYNLQKRTLSAGDIAGIQWIYGAVLDTTPPTTTSDAQSCYLGLATVHLSATDVGGSGVAATYYRIDNGAQTAGTVPTVLGIGPHTLEFWSVDGAGNIETPHKTASFTTYSMTTTLVWRFYNLRTGTHFYTADATERDTVINTQGSTYRFDGLAYTIDTAVAANDVPLYRFYNLRTGTHFYTADESEKSGILATQASTYHLDGVAYMVASTPTSSTPVYRFYNVRTGTHFYTADENEKASVIANLGATYRYEGPAFFIAH